MSTPRILVAGIGNIFLGDDAFGVEVARQLARRPQHAELRVVDFGIRGFDLAYALMDPLDAAILVDALPGGEAPGTVYLVEPDTSALPLDGAGFETHAMHPVKVLQMVRAMGGEPPRLLVVGCEPATLGPEEGAIGLSAPVAAAVPQAVALVESLVREIVDGRWPAARVAAS